jgi:NADH:ubiquinone oxidoreductase subunit 6 (subunit J)
MMHGIIVRLFGLGALLVLVFTLAVHVVPTFVGLMVGGGGRALQARWW